MVINVNLFIYLFNVSSYIRILNNKFILYKNVNSENAFPVMNYNKYSHSKHTAWIILNDREYFRSNDTTILLEFSVYKKKAIVKYGSEVVQKRII